MWRIERMPGDRFIQVYPCNNPPPLPTGDMPLANTRWWDETDWARWNQRVAQDQETARAWHERYPWLDLLKEEDRERLRVLEEQTGLWLLPETQEKEEDAERGGVPA